MKRQAPRTKKHYKGKKRKKGGDGESEGAAIGPRKNHGDSINASKYCLTWITFIRLAIRVFRNKEQLEVAVNEYMDIKDSGRSFPVGYSPIENWDVSLVTDFSKLFLGKQNFEGDLSKWDVSNGTTFKMMFRGCRIFNADLSRWDVSNATDLSGMFEGCEVFNADLSQWDVSSASSLRSMFQFCRSFNADLSQWDVSTATDLSFMFQKL